MELTVYWTAKFEDVINIDILLIKFQPERLRSFTSFFNIFLIPDIKFFELNDLFQVNFNIQYFILLGQELIDSASEILNNLQAQSVAVIGLSEAAFQSFCVAQLIESFETVFK